MRECLKDYDIMYLEIHYNSIEASIKSYGEGLFDFKK